MLLKIFVSLLLIPMFSFGCVSVGERKQNQAYIVSSPTTLRINDAVIDTKTGLMWQDNEANGRVQIGQHDAAAYCRDLRLGGYNDWRLPHINELKSEKNISTINPAVNEAFQNIAASWYWSSTVHTFNTSYAWYVGYEYGYGSYENNASMLYVRCVRDSKH